MGVICAKSKDDESTCPDRKKSSSSSLRQSISVHRVEFFLQDVLVKKRKKLDEFIKPYSSLLMFSETQAQLSDHPVFMKFGNRIGDKVQQFKDVKKSQEARSMEELRRFQENEEGRVKQSRSIEQDILILPIAIKNFNFKEICIVNVDVWGGDEEKTKIAESLKDKIKRALDKLAARGVKNLFITEVDEQFGIPQQICAQCLCQGLAQYNEKFESISMICSNEQSLEMHENYLNTVVMNKNNRISQFDAAGVNRKNSSVYF